MEEKIKPNPNEISRKRYYVTLHEKTVFESNSVLDCYEYISASKNHLKRFLVINDINQLALW